MTRKQLVFGLVAIAVIALGVIAYLVLFPSNADTALPSGDERVGVAVMPRDQTLGNPKAPIVMLEYGSLTCPVCARFEQDVFPFLKKNYIDTGKVYFIFRAFPRNAPDLAAEALARCLPRDRYFTFVDTLYRNQPKWDPEYGVSDVHGGLQEMGRVAGLAAAHTDRCMSDKVALGRANELGAEAETKYGVDGTPTFVIDGKVYATSFDRDGMKKLLDGLLKKH